MKYIYIQLLVVLMAGGANTHADFSSVVGAEAVYDDNIYRLESREVDSWITKIKPAVTLEMGQGTTTYLLEMDAETGMYSQSKLGDDDYTDYRAKGLIGWQFDIRNRFEASLQHRKGHDERGTARGDVAFDKLITVPDYDEPDEWVANRVGAKYIFGAPNARGSLSAGITYGEKNYTNNGSGTDILERDETEARLLGLLKVMPRTSLLLETRLRDIDYKDDIISGNRDSEDMRYFVGVQWEATAKTTGSVRVGYQDKTPDFSGHKDFNATTWEMDVVWSPRSYSTLELIAYRGAEDSGDALTYVDTHFFAAQWNHNWSTRFSTAVFARTETQEYQGFTRDDDISAWGFSASYLAREQIKLNGEYKYEDRDSNIAGLDYRRGVVLFGAEIAFE